jgi:hypothetical protein
MTSHFLFLDNETIKKIASLFTLRLLIKHGRPKIKIFNKIKNGTEADFSLKGATF